MADQRIQRRKQTLGNHRTPMQERSRARREEILRITGALLEQVGFDGLTTILIAKELKISVGSLYHYFPNKQAILYAIGEHWLEEYSRALEDIAAKDIESLQLEAFCQLFIQRLLKVYREQKGMLPLVHAMSAVPELHDLDESHDRMVISHMEALFERLNLDMDKAERKRKGRLWLEMGHALLVTINEQSGAKAKRSLEDLVGLSVHLLETSH